METLLNTKPLYWKILPMKRHHLTIQRFNDYEMLPTGYDIFRRGREDRFVGGTLIAIKSHLPAREISAIALSLEAVVLEIALNSCQTLLFINSYRIPSEKDFILKFKSTLLDSLQLVKYRGVFIVGVFNYPGIEWIDGSGFTKCRTPLFIFVFGISFKFCSIKLLFKWFFIIVWHSCLLP